MDPSMIGMGLNILSNILTDDEQKNIKIDPFSNAISQQMFQGAQQMLPQLQTTVGQNLQQPMSGQVDPSMLQQQVAKVLQQMLQQPQTPSFTGQTTQQLAQSARTGFQQQREQMGESILRQQNVLGMGRSSATIRDLARSEAQFRAQEEQAVSGILFKGEQEEARSKDIATQFTQQYMLQAQAAGQHLTALDERNIMRSFEFQESAVQDSLKLFGTMMGATLQASQLQLQADVKTAQLGGGGDIWSDIGQITQPFMQAQLTEWFPDVFGKKETVQDQYLKQLMAGRKQDEYDEMYGEDMGWIDALFPGEGT